MDTILQYLIENNQLLVFCLAAVTGLICLIWFFIIYQSVKVDASGSEATNVQSLKLKEVLRAKEKELDRMKHRFENQQKKLEDLQQNGPAESEALTSLKTEIEELKGRLSDYEIIEDDIANLSKYKEQNAELMAKLSQLSPDAAKKISQGKEQPEKEATASAKANQTGSENTQPVGGVASSKADSGGSGAEAAIDESSSKTSVKPQAEG